MARYNDGSPYPGNWSNAKLMREARRMANFEKFSGTLDRSLIKPIAGSEVDDEWNDAL